MEEVENKVINLLNKNDSGMTITDLVEGSKCSRSSIRTALAKLEGAKRIIFRNIGMAKVYTLRSLK